MAAWPSPATPWLPTCSWSPEGYRATLLHPEWPEVTPDRATVHHIVPFPTAKCFLAGDPHLDQRNVQEDCSYSLSINQQLLWLDAEITSASFISISY